MAPDIKLPTRHWSGFANAAVITLYNVYGTWSRQRPENVSRYNFLLSLIDSSKGHEFGVTDSVRLIYISKSRSAHNSLKLDKNEHFTTIWSNVFSYNDILYQKFTGDCFQIVDKPVLSQMSDSDGLAQDCSNSIANALELLQSCTNDMSMNRNMKLHSSEWSVVYVECQVRRSLYFHLQWNF